MRFDLGGGGLDRLLFVDVRRFGTGDVLLGSDALAEYFASRLGVEPLSPDFTAEALRALARGRKQPVKAFLLTQERVAGVGNIYADEALFRARIHPLRPVGTLRRPQVEALRDAVVETLEAGSTRRAPRSTTTATWTAPRAASRTASSCTRARASRARAAAATIRKLRAAGRGTYVCPRCQRGPKQPARPAAQGTELIEAAGSAGCAGYGIIEAAGSAGCAGAD